MTLVLSFPLTTSPVTVSDANDKGTNHTKQRVELDCIKFDTGMC